MGGAVPSSLPFSSSSEENAPAFDEEASQSVCRQSDRCVALRLLRSVRRARDDDPIIIIIIIIIIRKIVSRGEDAGPILMDQIKSRLKDRRRSASTRPTTNGTGYTPGSAGIGREKRAIPHRTRQNEKKTKYLRLFAKRWRKPRCTCTACTKRSARRAKEQT